METSKFGPGKYFIGDICYALEDAIYENFWGREKDYEEGEFIYNGFKFCTYGTDQGDGRYKGSDDYEYPVDAGVIGVVPEGLWGENRDLRDFENLGRIVEVEKELEMSVDQGVFSIKVDGEEFTIDTSNNLDDEEYEDEESEDEDYLDEEGEYEEYEEYPEEIDEEY